VGASAAQAAARRASRPTPVAFLTQGLHGPRNSHYDWTRIWGQLFMSNVVTTNHQNGESSPDLYSCLDCFSACFFNELIFHFRGRSR
jgi:hypothetical protein